MCKCHSYFYSAEQTCIFPHLSIKNLISLSSASDFWCKHLNLDITRETQLYLILLSLISGLKLFCYTLLFPGVNAMLSRLCRPCGGVLFSDLDVSQWPAVVRSTFQLVSTLIWCLWHLNSWTPAGQATLWPLCQGPAAICTWANCCSRLRDRVNLSMCSCWFQGPKSLLSPALSSPPHPHHYSLLQYIECNPLCYTVGLYWLSSLYIVVCLLIPNS